MTSSHLPVSPQVLARLAIVPTSLAQHDHLTFGLSERDPRHPEVVIIADSPTAIVGKFVGEISTIEDQVVLLGPLDAHNAAVLRLHVPWLRPQPLGLRTSVGLGDRLGLATPGHLHALQAVGGKIAPIPAQQSIREMTRTGRTPQQVLDDAMWGVIREGWRDGFGADADHLKTTEDIDRCVAAGYTFYTFDPSAYVDNEADSLLARDLRLPFDALPWDQLDDTPKDLADRYLSAPFDCEGHLITFDENSLIRAAVKYGRAMAYVATLYRHLAEVSLRGAWEVEVSVDETETPTTPAEHLYCATEMRRMGVHWVSMAPRFVGHFEKGVDYIGDIDEFAADFQAHAAIARTLGPYKISLHSGSDKFRIYALSAEMTRGVVHLKTAGTSYLEALRTVGEIEPDLLREIYAFARDRYLTDRASYHVSAQLDRAPEPTKLTPDEVSRLLDQFDARQILHVTFGSVLTTQAADGTPLFADRLMTLLRAYPAIYARNLTLHFVRHLQPFAQVLD